MSLLIDGHNLIGAGVIDGISLADEDDEARLVSRLRVWQSNYAGPMTVVFDHGITGGKSRSLSSAGVKVVFARNPQEADDLIRKRIQKRQRGLIVVTNDRALRDEAFLYDVTTWSATEFVERMQATGQAMSAPSPEAGTESHVALSKGEISEWADLFGPPPEPIKPARPVRSAFLQHTQALRQKSLEKKGASKRAVKKKQKKRKKR